MAPISVIFAMHWILTIAWLYYHTFDLAAQ